jgi:flagella basal body P-ring formation protein FlgA
MPHALAILCSVLLAAAANAQQAPSTITLRSTVLAPSGRPVTLADVALLAGEEAQRLGETPIDLAALRADPGGWRRIDAQSLRVTLDAHTPMWGSLQLRGGPCYVRTTAPQTEGQDLARPTPVVDAPAAPGTVRQLAERWIANYFKAAPADVEVRWVSATDGLLDHAIADLLPRIDDSGRSDRMSLRISLYDLDANVVIEGEARAEVRVRRDVAVLARDVGKRRIVNATDVRIERQWTDATVNPARAEAVVGREAAVNLKAGELVKASDVHAMVAIERGDRVQVRIITPTVTATLMARAMADGRPGETIPFETLAPSRSDRLRFEARVEHAGSAVAVALPGNGH